MIRRVSIACAGLLISGLLATASTLVDNRWFLPSPQAIAARQEFTGTLGLSEIEMMTSPAEIAPARVLRKNPKIFPAARLSFFTQDGDIVPVSQEVLRYGSTSKGKSYWDIIVQPGKVWSEPGEGGWSRASFPFALVHSLEGETHNGIAMFGYKDGKVSALHFQIFQQTAPFYIPHGFAAWGNVPVRLERLPVGDLSLLRQHHRNEVADQIPIASWDDLAAQVGAGKLANFDGAMPPGEILLSGLFFRGSFYLKESRTAAGPWPYLERARFGVWSVTKSAVTSVALLRLAQKYGDDVLDAKITDYLPATRNTANWRGVTFSDALNMATGLGNGTTKTEPNDIFDGEVDATYPHWYEARSEREKLEAVLATSHLYPWGPGKVARYRDQDMFLLGVAMDRYLKKRESNSASLEDMLRREVYAPIGIRDFPINHTIEADGRAGLPLMAFGWYPTLSDIIRIARLFQDHGQAGGQQILSRSEVDKILAGPEEKGLPTGKANRYGPTNYFDGFWRARYLTPAGATLFYPQMDGYGGNYVVLMPDGITAVRLAKSQEESAPVDDTTGMAAAAYAVGQDNH